MLKIEQYIIKHKDNLIQCLICPHQCRIKPGKTGICRIRQNIKGDLFLIPYGRLSALNIDPIEKKPLYHFYPGKKILSLGSIGCNMRCACCQNYSISQVGQLAVDQMQPYSISQIINSAENVPDNIGLAFTYNEPSVWYEYMLELAEAAKYKNLKTVMVSNGFINPEPLKQLLLNMDAFNIDVKAFSESVYRSFASAELKPVLANLKIIKEYQKHLEITYLLIPEINDHISDFTAFCSWIAKELGKDTILHISRYFPRYKLNNPVTSDNILIHFAEIASHYLEYVYLGNYEGDEFRDTICPQCSEKLIDRDYYRTDIVQIDESCKCTNCGYHVSGFFK